MYIPNYINLSLTGELSLRASSLFFPRQSLWCSSRTLTIAEDTFGRKYNFKKDFYITACTYQTT
ncbi:MAG: hypothetical protein IPM96_08575 [Ignavibacteria bacterium]|nr:hypothetical protein [Ignavibacteria bacterium]